MAQLSDITSSSPTVLDVVWQVCEDSTEDIREDWLYLRMKRAMDLIVGGLMFLVALPLMALIALAVKFDSRGPALFVQDRVGYDPETGETRIIKVYKFRTMRYRADESVHQSYVTGLIKNNTRSVTGQASLKMGRDPRVTSLGRILRKSSLDELPQLINVLKGDMSLIGPRPAVPYEVAAYDEWHQGRLQALPGMTGWWQVKGRNRVSFDEMVCMDLYYIHHRSLALDLKILALTPLAVLSTRGAG